mmetsp:Transcript_18732/g.40282  ORF Transcript_18732/g.40282 Transcript_18732/m.40282 type:complete len:210 (-) Transcript_18732:252-881(-)
MCHELPSCNCVCSRAVNCSTKNLLLRAWLNINVKGIYVSRCRSVLLTTVSSYTVRYLPVPDPTPHVCRNRFLSWHSPPRSVDKFTQGPWLSRDHLAVMRFNHTMRNAIFIMRISMITRNVSRLGKVGTSSLDFPVTKAGGLLAPWAVMLPCFRVDHLHKVVLLITCMCMFMLMLMAVVLLGVSLKMLNYRLASLVPLNQVKQLLLCFAL